MKPDPEVTCPYTGHKKKCKALYQNCPKWIRITGHDPQSGKEIDQYNCADFWIPMLMIENSRQQLHTASAVESFRNEMVEGNNQLAQVLLERPLTQVLEFKE